MRNRANWIVGVAVVAVAVGVGAIFILTLQHTPEPAVLPTKAAEIVVTVTPAAPPAPSEQPAAQAATDLKTRLQTLLEEKQEPFGTPVPLSLPEIPVPEGGQVYHLTPGDASLVGWFGQDNEGGNHLGDYNIYAGTYEGKTHIGAVQFDLSTIPPGSPIIHADLTLTGLSDEWLGSDGTWTVEMLAPWMDENWAEQDIYWFTRSESGVSALTPVLAANDLSPGQANVLYFPPETLPLLEARLYSSRVSFRILGPATEEDSLFSWDSGYGRGSRGQPPMLRIVTGPAPEGDGPPAPPTPQYVIITPVTDVVALANERLTATAQATPYEGPDTPTPTATATPFPPNWVTPVILVPTETPLNQATANWQAQVATAQAVVFGTATPWPPNVWTATPLPPPTSTPPFVSIDSLAPTPTMTPTPRGIPAYLKGKIMFYSDRTGENTLMFMNPDGSNVNVWQGDAWIYEKAREMASFSPDRQFQAIVQKEQVPVEQIFILSTADGNRQQLTHFDTLSYDPVWSPTGNTIAFVSPQEDGDEIYTIQTDGSGLQRLTENTWEWDKHPSWSPDGSQIVFWSNRETSRGQIWIMNADGSNPRNISNSAYNDWDPVWIK